MRVSSTLFALAAFAAAAPAQSQQVSASAPAHDHAMPPVPSMARDEIVAFAKVHVALGHLRDSAQIQLRLPQNNLDDNQMRLRGELRTKTADFLRSAGMTEDDFRRKTYIVSSNDNARATFDTVMSQLTGVPLPTKYVPAATTPEVKVPAGPVGMHIGHVVNSFRDTPSEQGLLSAAMSEARIAIQHAGLAAKAPTNLEAMKTHAGHVINAIDPTVVANGPGIGYGVKKAALGVAMHIDLAAKAAGASPNVVAHASHIAMAATNTVLRADQVVALARQIQAATSAADAAALTSQLVILTQQLVAGADANGDGKVTWERGEGGLQQVQEHVTLMLAGEHLPPG